jgi:hypothetical protein
MDDPDRKKRDMEEDRFDRLLESVGRGGSVKSISVPRRIHRKLSGHSGEVNAVAISSSGDMFATGGNDKDVIVWDSQSLSRVGILHGCTQAVMSLAFSANSDLLMATSNDNVCRIWSTSLQRLRHNLTGHTGKVLGCAFSGDSLRAVTGSHDRTIKLWDLNKGFSIRTTLCLSSCNDVDFVDGNDSVVSAHFDGSVRLWDARSGESVYVMDNVHAGGPVTSVQISDGMMEHRFSFQQTCFVVLMNHEIIPSSNAIHLLIPSYAPLCENQSDGQLVLSNGRDNVVRLSDIRMHSVLQAFQTPSYRNGLNWNRATLRYEKISQSPFQECPLWHLRSNIKIIDANEQSSLSICRCWELFWVSLCLEHGKWDAGMFSLWSQVCLSHSVLFIPSFLHSSHRMDTNHITLILDILDILDIFTQEKHFMLRMASIGHICAHVFT